MVIATSRITRNFQVTLPKYIRKPLHLHEGDLIGFEVMKGGKVTIVLLSSIDKDQAYYWTPRWQKAVAESLEDVKKGRAKKFKSVREARRALRA